MGSDSEMLKTQSKAAEYSAHGPKSDCTCSHTGDGANSEHAGLTGHGRCTVPGCGCGKFTWAGFLAPAASYLGLVKLTGPALVNGGRVLAEATAPTRSGTRDGRVVLVALPGERYATALHGRGRMAADGGPWDREWVWGHYFDVKGAAIADFVARAKRGY